MESTSDILPQYVPGGHFGFDRDGRPVVIEPIGRIDFYGLLHVATKDEIVAYKRDVANHTDQLCREQEARLGVKFRGRSTLILDAEGACRKHLWKPGVDCYKAIVQMIDREFPNLREKILVINTPSIFPVILEIMRKFMHSETKQRIKILGNDWRTKILEYVDADNLPEYYGGNRRDGDDDGKCPTNICYGGSVPRNLYLNAQHLEASEFECANIKSGKKFKRAVFVENARSEIHYEYLTNNFDIEFGVNYVTSAGEKQTLVKRARKKCDLIFERGVVECARAGKYVLVFDNRYCWVRDKNVYFQIAIKEKQ